MTERSASKPGPQQNDHQSHEPGSAHDLNRLLKLLRGLGVEKLLLHHHERDACNGGDDTNDRDNKQKNHPPGIFPGDVLLMKKIHGNKPLLRKGSE
jgi:hypothetical protein